MEAGWKRKIENVSVIEPYSANEREDGSENEGLVWEPLESIWRGWEVVGSRQLSLSSTSGKIKFKIKFKKLVELSWSGPSKSHCD